MNYNKLINRFNDNALGYLFPKTIKNVTDDIHLTINDGTDIGGFKFAVSPVYVRQNISKVEEDSFVGYRERRDEIAGMGPGLNSSNLLFSNQIITIDMKNDTEGVLIFKDVCDISYLRSVINKYKPNFIQDKINFMIPSKEKMLDLTNMFYENGWIINQRYLTEKYPKLDFMEVNVKNNWTGGDIVIEKYDISIPVSFNNNKEAVNFCQFITMLTTMFDGISAVDNPIVFQDELHELKHAIFKSIKMHIILSVYCAKFKIFKGIGHPYTSNFIISDPTICLLHGMISSDLSVVNYSTYNYALLDSLFDINNFVDFMINTGYSISTHPNCGFTVWETPASIISFIDQEYIIERYVSGQDDSSEFITDTTKLLRINSGSIVSPSKVGESVSVEIVVPSKDAIKLPTNRDTNLMDLPLDYNKIRGMMLSELKHQRIYTVMLLAKLHILDGDRVANIVAHKFAGDIASTLLDEKTRKFLKYEDYGKTLCAEVKNAFSKLFTEDDLYRFTSSVRLKMKPDKLYRIKRMQFLYENGMKMTHIKLLCSVVTDNMKVSDTSFDIPRPINILMDIFSIAEHTDVFEDMLKLKPADFSEIISKIFYNNVHTLNVSLFKGHANNYYSCSTGESGSSQGSVDKFIKYIIPIKNTIKDYESSKKMKRELSKRYEILEVYNLSDYLHNTLTICIDEPTLSILNNLYKIGVFDIELKRIRLFKNEISLRNGNKHSGEGSQFGEITFAQRIMNRNTVNADFTKSDIKYESKLFVLLLTLVNKMIKSAAISSDSFAKKLDIIVSENLELLRKKVKLISRTTVYGSLMNGVMNMLVLATYNYDVNDYVEIINRAYNNSEVQNLIAIESATFGAKKYSENPNKTFGTLYDKIMNFSSYYIDDFVIGFLSFGSITNVIKYLGGCSNQDLHNLFTSGLDKEMFIDRNAGTVKYSTRVFKHVLENKLNTKNIMEYARIVLVCPEYLDFSIIESLITPTTSIQSVLENIIKNEVVPKEFKRLIGVEKSDLLPKQIDIVDVEPDDNELKVHFHSYDDESVIYLGNVTNCCQVIGGAAEQCVIEGTINPYSGFISYRNPNGSIVAQSWIWLTHDGKTLVIDSVESRFVDKAEIITNSLVKWAKAQKYNIAIGSAHSKVIPSILESNGYTYIHRRDESGAGTINPAVLDMYDLVSLDDSDREIDIANSGKLVDYILSHDSDNDIREMVSFARHKCGKYKSSVMCYDIYNSRHHSNILRGFSVSSATGDMCEVYSDAASFHFLKNSKQK